jgi:hypothetical protein
MSEAADQPDEVWRAEMLAEIQSGEVNRVIDGLLRLTLNDPDRGWVEDLLIAHLDKSFDMQIRSLVITCLGHVARIHGAITKERVLPLLRELERDPALGGIAEDALSDIAIFAKS